MERILERVGSVEIRCNGRKDLAGDYRVTVSRGGIRQPHETYFSPDYDDAKDTAAHVAQVERNRLGVSLVDDRDQNGIGWVSVVCLGVTLTGWANPELTDREIPDGFVWAYIDEFAPFRLFRLAGRQGR